MESNSTATLTTTCTTEDIDCEDPPFRYSLGDTGDRQPDNDIVISPDLLMELSFIPPTAIDLKFHGGLNQRVDSHSGSNSTKALHSITIPLPNTPISDTTPRMERLPTHCLTGRASSRRTPIEICRTSSESIMGLSSYKSSVDTFPGYPSPVNSVLSFSTILANSSSTNPAAATPTSASTDAFPRLPREGRKPLQRFAPMLAVPPPQQTAFIEARRRQLRQLMNSSSRPPPNTPEHHSPARVQQVIMPSADIPPTARTGSLSARSRPSSRAGLAFRLTKPAPSSAQSRTSVEKKPIVLRMRKRHDVGDSATKTGSPRPVSAKSDKAVVPKSHNLMIPMPHVAPKMLIHQWLSLGNNERKYSQQILRLNTRCEHQKLQNSNTQGKTGIAFSRQTIQFE